MILLHDLSIATLSVTTDAGPITGCGIVFKYDRDARSFLKEAQHYYESPSTVEKAHYFRLLDRGTECDVLITLIADERYTELEFKGAPRSFIADLRGALASQPYFFVVLCRQGPAEGIEPTLTDELVMYHASLNIDGETVMGAQQGRWPSSGIVSFD